MQIQQHTLHTLGPEAGCVWPEPSASTRLPRNTIILDLLEALEPATPGP